MTVETALVLVVEVRTLCGPKAVAAPGSPETLDAYAHEVSESYYSTYSAPDLAAAVQTNNTRIIAICVAGGIMGFLPPYILYQNAVGVGQAGVIMADHDMLGVSLSLISSYGLLELTCVFIAGVAGLKFFWTMLVPGRRSHMAALAAEERALITVAVSLIVALAVAGLIETFVTPAPIPWLVKIATGADALALLWAYTLILGRSAVVAGSTGDFEEDEAGYAQPEAD